MKKAIYFDCNASTRIDPQVLSVMIECLESSIGNPSSIHTYGQMSKQQISEARRKVAQFFGVKSSEVIFTSGGTEGLVSFLCGFLKEKGPYAHLITSDMEHSAVYKTVRRLEDGGQPVTYLPGGAKGYISPDQVEAAITDRTALISLIAINNETGIKTDIEAIAKLANKRGIPFLVDAVCWMGKELFTLPEGVTALSIGGHKFHAPKGVGALIVRKGLKWTPLLTGGAQEWGKRAGTENLAGIVALGKAVERLAEVLPAASIQMEKLRDQFELAVVAALPGIACINGEGKRTCNTSNITFKGIDGEALIMNLDREGLMVSHGSACYAGAQEPSRVLKNMGLSYEEVRSSLRFSISRFTTAEEVEQAIEIVVKVVLELKELSVLSS